ncbi:hypothetical protein pb186bvf_011754 [Paramecium bursaria]
MRSKRMRRRLILRFASTISSKASTEIIEQPVVKKIKIEYTRVCGLQNIGNTCFLNSALQCVINTPQFNDSFLNDSIRNQIQPKHKYVALNYWNLLKKMRNQGQGGSENPQQLKQSLSNVCNKFRGGRQEDSQEFLRQLLTSLNEDLQRVTKPSPYRELQADIKKNTLQEISDNWWNYFKGRDDSLVQDYFTGQIINKVICQCNHQSIAFDNFQDLSLAFPSSSQCTLQQMIQYYLQQEVLSQYTCVCKSTRKAIKQQQIWRLPQILVFHLKRFYYMGNRKNKINTNVIYPTQLDMRQFINESNDKSCQQTKYELYGVVKHYGDLNFGHYFAECKHPFLQKWFVFNDSSVSNLSSINCDNSAYLLFYSKL